MKKALLIIAAILVSIGSFAQKVDWINAPLNPVARLAAVKDLNLKGDVFQYGYVHYNRHGQWIPYNYITDKNKSVNYNTSGKVVKEQDYVGSVTTYTYNSKGNILHAANSRRNSFYTYDAMYRLTKAVYENDQGQTSTASYSYNQQKDLLLVSEKYMNFVNTLVETEKHFKDGLEVYSKIVGSPASLTTYEFDRKGNWIKSTTINTETKQLIDKPQEREFIYHDEFNMGLNAITVISEKSAPTSTLLVPTVYLNGKRFNAPFSRFLENYIFYDEITKTYYAAIGAYPKNRVEGEKFAVSKLLSGSDRVLLYNGTNVMLVTNGKNALNAEGFIYKNYYGNYIVKDSVNNLSYTFGKLPATGDNKLIAIGARSMTEENASVLYIFDKERATILVFDRGELVRKPSVIGKTVVGDNLIIAANNIPKYVVDKSEDLPDQLISKGRYFDADKDKIVYFNQVAKPTQATQTASNTTKYMASNNTAANNSTSTDVKDYLAVYRNNPANVRAHLVTFYSSLVNKSYNHNAIVLKMASFSDEIFLSDKDGSYELLVNLPKEIKLSEVWTNLDKTSKAYHFKKAQEVIDISGIK